MAQQTPRHAGAEREEVSYIQLAQHLGINVSSEDADKLVKFAQQAYAAGEAAGIAAEREACAKVCDAVNAVEYKDDHWYHASEKCAADIRARGQA